MTDVAVRRRHVFFFSGFDPKGAAHYQRLYAEGAAAQQQATGHRYQVGQRERTDDAQVQGWQVQWRESDAPDEPVVHTSYEFLSWDDLVRAHWPRTVAGVALGSVLAYAAALSSGLALVRVWRQSRRTLVALAYPAIFWILALVGGAGLGWLAAQVGRGVADALAWPAPASTATAWAMGMLVGVAVGWGALHVERRLHTSWLLRIYRFADLWASGKLPDLEQRLDAMATRVLHRLQQGDTDEVLLVGYSVGSMLSASTLARVLQKCSSQAGGVGANDIRRLSMLTLGQCVPLLGLMPRAQAFRRELAVLARNPGVCWTDYSSPGDWGSFALVDPLEICRVTPPGPDRLRPRMLSPRFHTLFEPADYATLRSDKRRLHLQYLRSAPKAGAYDYFRLTAGPWRLGDNPQDHPPPEPPP